MGRGFGDGAQFAITHSGGLGLYTKWLDFADIRQRAFVGQGYNRVMRCADGNQAGKPVRCSIDLLKGESRRQDWQTSVVVEGGQVRSHGWRAATMRIGQPRV